MAYRFVHKYNPRSGLAANKARVWEKNGKKDLKSLLKVPKIWLVEQGYTFVVAIAYGKGVIFEKFPTKKMTGRFFFTVCQGAFQ